ncbi:hypothetical protein ACIPW9_36335 [Streptomyces sp. NPDC090052]|uniref:hypothetical protein n=1 Tax=Streptomyces sp. NPDC090052 TaxID=3365931 RepID=UPI0037F48832
MVKHHARKNDTRQRSKETGESHQTAARTVRKDSHIPDPPTSAEMLAEGRTKICEALALLAEQESRPRLRDVYVQLREEVAASETGADLAQHRANFAFRRADDVYRRQWDAMSADPPSSYDEHMQLLNGFYWSRRVTYEWWRPGVWGKARRG